MSVGYEEWGTEDDSELVYPIDQIHAYHNVVELRSRIYNGSTDGYIYCVDTERVIDNLELFDTNDANREVVYRGLDLEYDERIPHTVYWHLEYRLSPSRWEGFILPAGRLSDLYDPPLQFDLLPDHLKDDETHKWRAKTGIELIHKEPSLKELQRIWKNWHYMDK